MRYMAVLIMAAVTGLCSLGAMAASDSELQDFSFPHAGITLSVPKSYQIQVPSTQTTFLSLVKSDGREPVATLELGGYPVDGSVTLDKFSQQSVDSMRRNLVIRNLRELKQVKMPIAGLPGVVRLVSYKFRGEQTLTAITCFAREIKPDLWIMYSLTIDCMEKEKDSLLPLLGKVAQSVKLIDVKNTWESFGEFNNPIGSSEHGFMIRPPVGWFANLNQGNVLMGQINYLTATMTPMFQINSSKSDSTDPTYCGKMLLEKATASLSQNSLETTVLSQGPAKLGGVNAYQFTIRQLVKNPSTAPAGENPPITNFIVQRCISMPYNDELKLYSLVAICSNGDQKQAEMVMDKLAEGFKLLKSASEPADTPAGDAAAAPGAQAGDAATTPAVENTAIPSTPTTDTAAPAGGLSLPEAE